MSDFNKLWLKAQKKHASKAYIEAKKIYLIILRENLDHPEVLKALADVEFRLNNFHESIKYSRQALSIEKNNPEIAFNIGLAFQSQKKFKEAIDSYKEANQVIQHYNATFNMGECFNEIGLHEEAVDCFLRAETINHKDEDLYINFGKTFTKLKNYENAIKSYKMAIKLNPLDAGIHNQLGFSFSELKMYAEAMKSFNEAIKLNPKNPHFYFNLGNLNTKIKDYKKAVSDFTKAIEIDPYESIYLNFRAIAYDHLDLFTEALNDFHKALELSKNNSDYLCNLGILYQKRGFLDKANVYFNQSIESDGSNEQAFVMRSLTSLYRKDFILGWRDYEKRHLFYKSKYLDLPKPLLDKPSNKKIYIWPEQGIGDQIIYASILHEVIQDNNKLLISLEDKLIPLFQRSFPEITFASKNQPIQPENYDYQISIGSLCQFYRKDIQSFKQIKIPYLKVNKFQSQKIRESVRLGTRKIIGVSWKSENKDFGHKKSISLNELGSIFDKNNIYINLQYGDILEEKKLLFNKWGINLVTLDEIDNFNDIDGLASLISTCDEIITVSNITAHIAGALGKKSYLLLPFSSGRIWYWHENDTNSCWYPSVQLISQTKLNDWNDALKILNTLLLK